VHHVGILYDQFMMHGQRNIKLQNDGAVFIAYPFVPQSKYFSITVKWGHISLWAVKTRVS